VITSVSRDLSHVEIRATTSRTNRVIREAIVMVPATSSGRTR